MLLPLLVSLVIGSFSMSYRSGHLDICLAVVDCFYLHVILSRVAIGVLNPVGLADLVCCRIGRGAVRYRGGGQVRGDFG